MRPNGLIMSRHGTIIAEIRGYLDSCGNRENAEHIIRCSPDRIRAIAAYVEQLERELADARRQAFEEAAQIAEGYGPSRPITGENRRELIIGRWEGEQPASLNIAKRIRAKAQPHSETRQEQR